jgi:hypothetical protein
LGRVYKWYARDDHPPYYSQVIGLVNAKLRSGLWPLKILDIIAMPNKIPFNLERPAVYSRPVLS